MLVFGLDDETVSEIGDALEQSADSARVLAAAARSGAPLDGDVLAGAAEAIARQLEACRDAVDAAVPLHVPAQGIGDGTASP